MEILQHLLKESQTGAVQKIRSMNLGFAKITLLVALVPLLTALVLLLFILPFSGAVASPSPAPNGSSHGGGGPPGGGPDESLIYQASLDAAADLANIDFTDPDVDSQVILDLIDDAVLNIELVGEEQVNDLFDAVGVDNIHKLDPTSVSAIVAVMEAVDLANQSPLLNDAVLKAVDGDYYGGTNYDLIVPTDTLYDLLADDAPVTQVDGQEVYVAMVQDGDNQLVANALNPLAALFAQQEQLEQQIQQ